MKTFEELIEEEIAFYARLKVLETHKESDSVIGETVIQPDGTTKRVYKTAFGNITFPCHPILEATDEHVDYDNPQEPMFRTVVGGYNYAFALWPIQPDKREWLAEVVARQMQEIHDRAVKETEAELQRELRKLLGLN